MLINNNYNQDNKKNLLDNNTNFCNVINIDGFSKNYPQYILSSEPSTIIYKHSNTLNNLTTNLNNFDHFSNNIPNHLFDKNSLNNWDPLLNIDNSGIDRRHTSFNQDQSVRRMDEFRRRHEECAIRQETFLEDSNLKSRTENVRLYQVYLENNAADAKKVGTNNSNSQTNNQNQTYNVYQSQPTSAQYWNPVDSADTYMPEMVKTKPHSGLPSSYYYKPNPLLLSGHPPLKPSPSTTQLSSFYNNNNNSAPQYYTEPYNYAPAYGSSGPLPYTPPSSSFDHRSAYPPPRQETPYDYYNNNHLQHVVQNQSQRLNNPGGTGLALKPEKQRPPVLTPHTGNASKEEKAAARKLYRQNLKALKGNAATASCSPLDPARKRKQDPSDQSQPTKKRKNNKQTPANKSDPSHLSKASSASLNNGCGGLLHSMLDHPPLTSSFTSTHHVENDLYPARRNPRFDDSFNNAQNNGNTGNNIQAFLDTYQITEDCINEDAFQDILLGTGGDEPSGLGPYPLDPSSAGFINNGITARSYLSAAGSDRRAPSYYDSKRPSSLLEEPPEENHLVKMNRLVNADDNVDMRPRQILNTSTTNSATKGPAKKTNAGRKRLNSKSLSSSIVNGDSYDPSRHNIITKMKDSEENTEYVENKFNPYNIGCGDTTNRYRAPFDFERPTQHQDSIRFYPQPHMMQRNLKPNNLKITVGYPPPFTNNRAQVYFDQNPTVNNPPFPVINNNVRQQDPYAFASGHHQGNPYIHADYRQPHPFDNTESPSVQSHNNKDASQNNYGHNNNFHGGHVHPNHPAINNKEWLNYGHNNFNALNNSNMNMPAPGSLNNYNLSSTTCINDNKMVHPRGARFFLDKNYEHDPINKKNNLASSNVNQHQFYNTLPHHPSPPLLANNPAPAFTQHQQNSPYANPGHLHIPSSLPKTTTIYVTVEPHKWNANYNRNSNSFMGSSGNNKMYQPPNFVPHPADDNIIKPNNLGTPIDHMHIKMSSIPPLDQQISSIKEGGSMTKNFQENVCLTGALNASALKQPSRPYNLLENSLFPGNVVNVNVSCATPNLILHKDQPAPPFNIPSLVDDLDSLLGSSSNNETEHAGSLLEHSSGIASCSSSLSSTSTNATTEDLLQQQLIHERCILHEFAATADFFSA